MVTEVMKFRISNDENNSFRNIMEEFTDRLHKENGSMEDWIVNKEDLLIALKGIIDE